MAEVVGNISVVATINTKDYDAGKKAIEKGNEGLESGAKKTSKGFSGAWIGAIAGVAASLTNTFLGAIKSSIGGAVKRVDTLKNSSRTFENMGIASIDSSKSMKALEKSIKGLPTPLDAAVRGMTDLTATYGDIDKGQKVFSALNNAILGFGGSSAMVDNAITQLSQLPMDGPLDAQTWNSLRNSGITPVLTAMAKDSNMSVSEMKEAFGSGELSVQDFTDRLLKMNTEGGGGLASLEKIAKDSTTGIGTGFSNMQTSITRGVAGIIEDIGSENISASITGVGDAFTVALGGVSGLINFVKDNSGVFSTLAVAIGTAGAAVLLYSGYVKVATAFTAAYTAVSSYLTLVNSLQAQGLGVLRAAWLALNIVMRANPIGIVITLIAALVAGIIWFFTQTETGKKIMEDFFKFMSEAFTNISKWAGESLRKVVGFFTDAWSNIKRAFSAVGSFFIGVWNTITGIFSKIGSAIGDAIGGAFKNVINGILKFAVGMINKFIDGINTAVDIINNIPGVNIGTIGRLPVPQLAAGGITTGPTLAMIGEGREQEAVLPLSKLEAMLNRDDSNSPVQPTQQAIVRIPEQSSQEYRQGAINTIKAYNEYLKSQSLPLIGVAR